MTMRDDLLPVFDSARSLIKDLGLRRFAVTVRRRSWSGTYIGDGTPIDQDITLSPLPRVRQSFASASRDPRVLEYLLAKGNVVDDRIYTVDKITPAYSGGGYTAEQLRLWAPPDAKNLELIVVLTGDDGFRRDCVQLSVAQDRAFGYSMTVRETDRPRAPLASLAVSPSSISVVVGATVLLAAIGTFADGDTSTLTPLVTWSSSNTAVATVDAIGRVRVLSAGTATITASLTGITANATVTVS
jgi:uncharacterized protein YjdB